MTRFLLELTWSRKAVVLDRTRAFVDIECSGWDLEERLAGRVPPLPNEQHLPVPIERHDRHGARMTDDVTLRDRPVGPLDRVDPERQVVAAPEDLGVEQTLAEVRIGLVEGQAAMACRWPSSDSPVSESKR